ncbi:hypothetical protein HPB48_010343 [Haemaphysalis longicornis]|uniref:DUF4371 domain-containing protein n=1 Tax=Haemaphysalis longicornis TaxID=44386 RepID=A0A9J6H6V6_HAELO|nr:hypothetical protein HPB48_010343 [Haemaphysalis longicornis]
MAHTVQRDIIKDIKCSPFYGIIADGTTDITGNEQFTFCVRWVHGITLEVREEFSGMYNAPDSRAETLYKAEPKKQQKSFVTAWQKLRSDASFDVLWQRTNSRARELSLKEPSVPRVSQPPRRLQFTDKPREPAALDTKSSQRKEFFAAIDRITNEIRRRFEQPGMEQLIGLERISPTLLKVDTSRQTT